MFNRIFYLSMSAQQIIGKKGNLELIFGNKNRKELIQAVNEMTTDFNYEKLLLKKVKIENDLDIICFILSTLYQNYLIKKTKIEKENGEDRRDFYFKLLYKIVEILAFSNKEAEKEMTRNINFTKLLFCLLLLGVVKNAPKAYENLIRDIESNVFDESIKLAKKRKLMEVGSSQPDILYYIESAQSLWDKKRAELLKQNEPKKQTIPNQEASKKNAKLSGDKSSSINNKKVVEMISDIDEEEYQAFLNRAMRPTY